ncbi:MAG: hypothetical protein IJQ85_06725, partial [Selenomonadaceae bacterium]|nr:hypothetical protein [Selenomonadaceae bacterium]
ARRAVFFVRKKKSPALSRREPLIPQQEMDEQCLPERGKLFAKRKKPLLRAQFEVIKIFEL